MKDYLDTILDFPPTKVCQCSACRKERARINSTRLQKTSLSFYPEPESEIRRSRSPRRTRVVRRKPRIKKRIIAKKIKRIVPVKRTKPIAGGKRWKLKRRKKRNLLLGKRRIKRPAITVSTLIKTSRFPQAIRQNLKFARILGWDRYQSRIRKLLGLLSASSIDRAFVRAVARWQKRKGIRANGIIDTTTWRSLRRVLGITSKISLAPPKDKDYFKDNATLKSISLQPADRLPQKDGISGRITEIYNRQGKLMRELADRVNLDLACTIAVWVSESHGRRHRTGKTPGRFENHRFYRIWGVHNQKIYDRHFRHGGHAGISGNAWQQHQFRKMEAAAFQLVHKSQEQEYRVLQFAKKIADPEKAIQAFRLGEPQILPLHYADLGYTSSRKMYNAFQNSLRAQILGFFDYCLHRDAPERGELLVYLRNRNWRAFCKYYNPDRNVAAAAIRLQDIYNRAASLVRG